MEYPNNSTTDLSNTRFLINDEVQRTNKKNEQTVVSFIGAGNYARLTLIPAFKKNDVTLTSISSLEGLSYHNFCS